MATTEPRTRGVRAEDLQPLFDGRYGSLRRQIRDVMGGADFVPPIAIPTAEYRELVLTWMQAFAAKGLTAPGFPVEYGGHGDPGANIAGFETIAYGDLYALYRIEADRGYLQEHGRLSGPRCKGVTREVNRLCDEVRGDAEALVDAFGIPDEVLRAPIAVR